MWQLKSMRNGLFLLATSFCLLTAFQNFSSSDSSPSEVVLTANLSASSAANSACFQSEQAWGQWCVYSSGVRATPIIYGFDNIYHASIWYRNGQLNMVASGWKTPASDQGFHDRVYRLATQDGFGISGWTIINGSKSADDPATSFHTIGQDWESPSTWNKPSDAWQSNDCRNGSHSAYCSVHSTQPSVLSIAEVPGGFTCCDTLYYGYDNAGTFPESKVGVHFSYWDEAGHLQSTGAVGQIKNSLLDWHTYDSLHGPGVAAVSDARGMYDSTTKKFYMIYGEWLKSANAEGNSAVTSLAVANWSNQPYSVVARDLGHGAYLGNPQLLHAPSGIYILFYTQFLANGAAEIRARTAKSVLGPYSSDRLVMKAPATQPLVAVGTPNVFCNQATHTWQMYFSANEGENNDSNQIYTAFLNGKTCAQDPLL